MLFTVLYFRKYFVSKEHNLVCVHVFHLMDLQTSNSKVSGSSPSPCVSRSMYKINSNSVSKGENAQLLAKDGPCTK